jgi:hypothetical protein
MRIIIILCVALAEILTLTSAIPAVAQIAPGVEQSAAKTATINGIVLQNGGKPVAGADVELIGVATLKTRSDARGVFSFSAIPFGTYLVVVDAPDLGQVQRGGIVINGDVNVEISYAPAENGLKTIADVSTKSAGASINVTPASIYSIGPSDYAFQGNISWSQLLSQVPGVVVGGELSGGDNATDNVPGSPLKPVVISINGALPYETSVTLDGMPLYNTSIGADTPGAGTDLSYLPMSTFDTADIVRGAGANAPSIVDSIGGSLVLHPTGFVSGSRFEMSVSNDAYGGVLTNMKEALRVNKRLSIVASYGINDSPGPLGTSYGAPFFATPATINGLTFSSCGPPVGSTCNALANAPGYPNSGSQRQSSLLLCCAAVSTAWSEHAGSLDIAYELAPSITAEVFYAGSSAQTDVPSYLFTSQFTPGATYTGGIPAGQYNFYSPRVDWNSTQASGLIEEKLTAYIGPGVLRVAALQNNSYYDWGTPYFGTYPSGQYTLYGTGYSCSNPPACTSTAPVAFNGNTSSVTFQQTVFSEEQRINNRDLLFSYGTQVGSASELGTSFVASYYNGPQTETYDGELLTNQPSSVSATTYETRLNASTQISNKLAADASWYFAQAGFHIQNPSDPSGQTWTNPGSAYNAPRMGVVWRANRDLAFRAAAGGGFALPPLPYIVGYNAIYPDGPGYIEYGENINLKPEESFGFDIGADARLKDETVVSLDLYRTNLFGQFYSSTQSGGMYEGAPLYIESFGNLGQSRYEGVNLSVHHDRPIGFYWRAALGLTRAYVVNVPAGFYDDPSQPCTNCANTNVVPGINFNGSFASAVPYANGSAQIGYRWKSGLSADLDPTYYGNDNAYYEPAFVEFDGRIAYPVTRNLTLSATFRNITGIYDQSFQLFTPTIAAPLINGAPASQQASTDNSTLFFGIPYGPRTVTVTASVRI